MSKSQDKKIIVKASYIKAYDSPPTLTDGTQANVYYLGEDWVEGLTKLLGFGKDGIDQIRQDLDSIRRLVAMLGEGGAFRDAVKSHILKVLGTSSKRRRDFFAEIPFAFWLRVGDSLEELVKEGKVTYQPKGGWYKTYVQK